MRITFTDLQNITKKLADLTGKSYAVAPFPAPGPNGYNLTLNDGSSTIKSGRPARELHQYIEGLCDGIEMEREEQRRWILK